MLRKSGGSVSCASSAMVPASSTPVGPAPTMTKVSSAARRCGIGLALGALERHQNAPPQRGGVLQRLQAGRERLPFVMAEIGVARAGGENQRVVGQGVAVIEQHALVRGIDAAHGGEQGRDLGAVAQQIADRPGDLGGRQRRGRDLIEQRLEQMMVAPVDQRDRDRRAGKPIAPSPARRSRRRRSPRDGVCAAAPVRSSCGNALRFQISPYARLM